MNAAAAVEGVRITGVDSAEAREAGLQPGMADLCFAVLDEIDHGLLVLGNRGEVKFANRAAWRACFLRRSALGSSSFSSSALSSSS